MSLNDLPKEEESWTYENEDVTKHVENRSKAKNDEDESQEQTELKRLTELKHIMH